MRNTEKTVTKTQLNTCIEVSMDDTSYVGLHLFCKISRQIPPSAYTLGWNIFVLNLTVGGLLGYSSVNSKVSRKVPSSKGVSIGLRAEFSINITIRQLETFYNKTKKVLNFEAFCKKIYQVLRS